MRRCTAFIALLVFVCAGQNYNESDWQVAFNKKVTNGQLEYPTPNGRADIVSAEYAIEVEHAGKYQEGIGQAQRYAKATGRKAGLALFIDGAEDSYAAFEAARKACDSLGIKIWLINETVTVNDLVSQKNAVTRVQGVVGAETGSPAPEQSAPSSYTTQKESKSTECQYWINTKSGVRHNSSCRWFMNTKNGRCCGANDGRPCGTCGG